MSEQQQHTTKPGVAKSVHHWTERRRRKSKKRKSKSARFTKKKVRTTTSNIRIPKHQRRRLYRDRCKLKKDLEATGYNVTDFPYIDHENPLIVRKDKFNQTYCCKHCNQRFKSIHLLSIHLTKHKTNKQRNDGKENEFPDIMTFTKSERKELLRRLLEMEKNENNNNNDDDDDIKQDINIQNEQKQTDRKILNDFIDTSNIPILGQFNNNNYRLNGFERIDTNINDQNVGIINNNLYTNNLNESNIDLLVPALGSMIPINISNNWICKQCMESNRNIDFYCTVCGYIKGYDPKINTTYNEEPAPYDKFKSSPIL